MGKYEAPELEIIRFENEDVITSSCPSDMYCPTGDQTGTN